MRGEDIRRTTTAEISIQLHEVKPSLSSSRHLTIIWTSPLCLIQLEYDSPDSEASVLLSHTDWTSRRFAGLLRNGERRARRYHSSCWGLCDRLWIRPIWRCAATFWSLLDSVTLWRTQKRTDQGFELARSKRLDFSFTR